MAMFGISRAAYGSDTTRHPAVEGTRDNSTNAGFRKKGRRQKQKLPLHVCMRLCGMPACMHVTSMYVHVYIYIQFLDGYTHEYI